MGLFRSQASQKPTALGTMVQASVYGNLLYLVFGCAKAPPYPIWAANLRRGGSVKKAKKKKGPPTYVENIDMFVGQNPIQGILDIWSNTSNHYPLNFVKLSSAVGFVGGPFGFWDGLQLSDPYFYELVAVTANVTLAGAFDDYGDPSATNGIDTVRVSLTNPGSGYNVNDTFTVNGGSSLAQGHVTSVGGGGAVTGVAIDVAGAGYAVFNGIHTTTVTGGGSGLYIDILTVGNAYNVVSEYPLWNAAQHGPDLINAAGSRWYPYCYYWTPAISPYVYIPAESSGTGIPNNTGEYNFYYAQLSSVLKRRSPLVYNRFNFEQSLGSGTEYSDAGLSAQQDIKPDFAGVESSDTDLGSGAIPAWRFEVHGSYTFLPPRDAEFADMIEEFVKSGQKQVGEALGLIHTGCNCNDLPGIVQKAYLARLEPNPTSQLAFSQPNAAGSIILAFFRWRPSTGSNPVISDTPIDTWTPIFETPYAIFAYATSLGAIAGNIVQAVSSLSGFAYDNRVYLFEMDPGSNTVLKTANSQGVNSGPAQKVSCSIYVPQACYIMVALEVQGFDTTTVPPHWDNITNPFANAAPAFQILKRYVTEPGVYTFSLGGQTGYWNIGMIAMGGQPSPLPAALGNILDDDSFFQTRLQCRAGGLQGSLATLSQRSAQDWLTDLFKASDAAPVWDGFKLYSIPMSEVSAVGQGAVYNAPTAGGPIVDLEPSDFVGDASTPMITVERQAQVDADNVFQVQCNDRNNNYDQSMIMEPQTGAIALYGERVADPIVLPMIVDPAVGRKIAAIAGRRFTMLRNIYKFTLFPKFLFLRAMALVTVSDPLINLSKQPVRLTSFIENDKGEFDCEAEPFVYGVHAPNTEFTAPAVAPNNPNFIGVPADVNAPIFLEPVPRLQSSVPQGLASSPQQLWIVVSDSDPNYGGCAVMISTDGGASYQAIGTILGNAITGYTKADWPIANDPDTANSLPLDLTESLGVLSSYSAADRDEFTYPCYIDHGTAAIPYGLMTYNLAVLTAANKYTLTASGTGNELRRCVFGAPQPLTDVDHPNGSRWAFLNPNGQGIFKVNLDPKWIGITLYFKFLAFNQFQSSVEDLADATAYPYTPTGVAAAAQPSTINYSITGGALTNPTPTTIDMAQATGITPNGNVNYNARVFTISAPSVPTTYYVTIYDPQHLGDTGATTNLSAYAETTTAKVGLPGYVYIGSITVLPAGGGTVTTPGGSNPGDTLEVNGTVIQ